MTEKIIEFFMANIIDKLAIEYVRNIFLIITSLITIFVFLRKRKLRNYIKYDRKLNINNYSIVDRKDSFEDALKLLASGCRLMQVNGASGIGKSYFLKFFSELVNNNVHKKIIKEKRLKYIVNHVRYFKAIYIDAVSISEFQQILNKVAKKFFEHRDEVDYEQFAKLIDKKIKKKSLILIFDNINNRSLHIELNNFMSIYCDLRPNDLIFIGTNTDFTYNIKSGTITLTHFGDKEILEFYKTYNYPEPKNLEEVERYTMGLPIYLSLYLNNIDHLSLDDINKKIIILFNNCNHNEKMLLGAILYISLINTSVEYEELIRLPFKNLDDSLESLKSKFLIIENSSSYKVHDQIGKILLKHLFLNKSLEKLSDHIILILIDHYSRLTHCHNKHLTVFFQLLLHNNDDSKMYLLEVKQILEFFRKQLVEESYTYILVIGNYFFDIISKVEVSYLFADEKLTSELYKLYILALQYTGDYDGAQLELNKYKMKYITYRIDEIKTQSQYEIFFIEADTFHLHCNYSGAISQFQFLLEVAKNKGFDDFYIKTIYQIAHNERHKGRSLLLAKEWYERTVLEAKRINYVEYIIRGTIGVISINILIDDVNYDFDSSFNQLFHLIKQSDKSNTTLAYVHKYYGRYHLRYNNFDSAFKHYNLAEDIYKSCNSRKNKYLLFDWAEFYRTKREYEKAIYYYDRCITFGKNSNDYNLINYSELGKLLINAQKINSNKLIKKCNELIYNAQKVNNETFQYQAELVKKYLQNEIITEINTLISFYKARQLFREVNILNRINKGQTSISDFQLNLV